MTNFSVKETAQYLKDHDNFLIIAHRDPDGDATGSAVGLALAMQAMGKKAKITCSDPFRELFSDIISFVKPCEIESATVVAVDTAEGRLLGERYQHLTGEVNLNIDHHISNKGFSKHRLLLPECGSCAEIIYLVIKELGTPVTPEIAKAIYTGICTDTGALRYSSVTPQTLRIAAELMEAGAENFKINKLHFETKSRERVAIERAVLDTLKYYFDGKVAVISITDEMFLKTGATLADLDGIATIPKMIKDVEIGVTLKQKGDGFKVSLRSSLNFDSSAICAALGGGGHARAAGFEIKSDLETAIKTTIDKIAEFLN